MPMITLILTEDNEVTTVAYGRSQPTLAVAKIHHNLQQMGIKP
jgi:hypothetical protein